MDQLHAHPHLDEAGFGSLVFDLGNSVAKVGLFRGQTLYHTFRIPGGSSAPFSVWEASLREAAGSASISAAGLSSVVPGAAVAIGEAVERVFHVPLVEIQPTMRLPFELAYETPHTLGADRLAAAAAAHVMLGQAGLRPQNVVVVDAGTAVTYEVIDRTGVYRGGCISPGPALMQRSLHVGTAQLPEVPLELPTHTIGRSTTEALQSGILYGYIDGVRGMILRLSAELDEPPIVVATGGWSGLLAGQIAEIGRVEPHLVLHGVRILLELNTPRP